MPTQRLTARYHSFESGSATDGPGLRSVLFLQGCHMRCQYCHNPDTWAMEGGHSITIPELEQRLRKNLDYYRSTGGGLTISGGEPLLQAEFVAAAFHMAHKLGISTALDTNGFPAWTPHVEAAIAEADLVMLDIKEATETGHHALTAVPQAPVLNTLRRLVAQKQRLWIRHVLIPNWTASDEHVRALAHLLAPFRHGIERIDFLPFHRLGMYKWHELKQHCPLETLEPLSGSDAKECETLFYEHYHD